MALARRTTAPESAPDLRSSRFRAERESNWRELERIVGVAEKKGLRSLSARDVAALPVLYRSGLSSLSVARAISLDRNVVEYLDDLCSRAYFVVYGPKRGVLDVAAQFLVHDFPRSVRAAWPHLALSTLVFGAGTVTGLAMVLADPGAFYAFVDGDLAGGRDPAASTEFLREGLFDDAGGAADQHTAFAAFLWNHNAQIGLLCCVLGVAGGVPVFLMLFTNGLMLGAFAALYGSRGLGVELASWILPHGVTEILALVLCGAAGFRMADGLLFPGRQRRADSVIAAGRDAATIAIGCILLFFLAALLEGYFRQMVQSVPVRFVVVLVTTVAWAAYFVIAGRRRTAR